MNSKQNSLSFLSKFDPNEFFDLAKDLPAAFELNDDTPLNQSVSTSASNNIEILGTHLLLPQSSLSQALENQLAAHDLNSAFVDVEFENFLDSACANFDANNIEYVPLVSKTPLFDPFSGNYGFKVKMTSTSDKNLKKNTPWTFSKVLNKLYCAPGMACPIEFSVDIVPPTGSVIKAEPVYAKREHMSQLPKRCENHKISKQFENNDKIPEDAIYHLIRCQHAYATYRNYVDSYATQRHCVEIPFEIPQTGSEYTTALYQFMCFSSCIGGNQKPIKIVLTLEYNGEVLGRGSFEVKICACPGRDRVMDEKKLEKEMSKKPTVSATNKVEIKFPNPKDPIIKPSIKQNEHHQIRIKTVSSSSNQIVDNEVFTLRVKGRKNYEILKKLNEALDLQAAYLSRMNGVNSLTNNNKNDNNGTNKLISKLTSSTNTMKRKISNENCTNLEEFLEKIDMSAYYNMIISKGIKNLEDILNCTKRKIDNLKISESDTKKLWKYIQDTKLLKQSDASRNKYSNGHNYEPDFKRSKRSNQLNKVISLSNTDSLFEIARYQINYK